MADTQPPAPDHAASEFIAYWRRVRGRTLSVANCIPGELVDWTPGFGIMTFGDLLRHLAVTERWLFVEVACGRPSRYATHGGELARSLPDVLRLLHDLHRDSQAEINRLPDLESPVITPGGATMPARKWLRAMLEHEAHHRGQLFLLLRMCGIPTLPVFGMTSEQVRGLARD